MKQENMKTFLLSGKFLSFLKEEMSVSIENEEAMALKDRLFLDHLINNERQLYYFKPALL